MLWAKVKGRFGIIVSCPGRGKTLFIQTWAEGTDDAIYLRKSSIQSELDFMQAFCIEAGIALPPRRRGKCYAEIIQRLRGTDRPVFIDEAQTLPRDFLNANL